MFIDRTFYNWLRLLVYECLSILSLSNRPTDPDPGKADLELCKNHRISQPAVLEEPWRQCSTATSTDSVTRCRVRALTCSYFWDWWVFCTCSMKRHSRYHSGLTELRLQTVHDDILYIYVYMYMYLCICMIIFMIIHVYLYIYTYIHQNESVSYICTL